MRRCLFFFVLVSCVDADAPATAPPAPTPGEAGTPPSAAAGEATAPDATVLEDLEWKDLVTGVSASGDVFADVRGVWRCEDGACQHRPWSGGDGGRQALPCDASSDDKFAVSPAGTRVAQVCEGKLAISTLTTGEVVRRKSPFPELDDLEVDESGVVTAIHEHRVARVTAKGLQGPFALEVPKEALTPTNFASLYAANGPWLAYTHGAYSDEVAWRASTPAPTQVALGGGALFNGEQMWVSLMTNGYVRMTESGPVPVAGRIGGGLPGHGLLLSVLPWGADGLIAQYEDAALLVDRELNTRRQLRTPNAKGTYGTIGSDPSGAWLFFVHEDGRIAVAAL
ncbi:hypothetical protein OV203_47940 [Nannocystis sp. ILAH1]|uniref:hypothetical protein n=1 Tax=Nannocystis sp. ILAH1 TaxID=2996789 RepID=UPI00226E0BBE|nr:hypothetical protein [Nannocystis sp. ILAH1]MCY0994952.1 hypothetical protein [Nannocystis sp. ILAH1]